MSSTLVIVGYAGIYSLACVLELGRLFRRVPGRAAAVGARRLTIIALAIHTLYLATRIFQAISARGMPLANWSDWCLIAAWFLALAFLLLAERRPGFGMFLLPMVWGLVLLAILLPDGMVFQKAQTARMLGMVHGVALLLGTVTVLLGFSAGLMYLLQAYRLKQKTMMPRFRLPSLEYLQRANERALVYSSFFLMLGMATGIMLNLVIAHRAGESLPWNDPTVLISALLATWIAAAWLFAACYRPVRHTRKVAYLTVASFVALAMTLAMAIFGPSSHARPDATALAGHEATGIAGDQARLSHPPDFSEDFR